MLATLALPLSLLRQGLALLLFKGHRGWGVARYP